jgi:predicted peroxiredoxin
MLRLGVTGVMQNKKTDKNLEELIEAVKKRGVKCQICGYIPKFREEFQLTLVNDKLTCSKCSEL